MDFFEHQNVARRKTRLLVGYYCVAVALIVVAVYLAVLLISLVLELKTDGSVRLSQGPWNPTLFLLVAAVTLAIVVLGSLYKFTSLRAGGKAVARDLGGRPLRPNTKDFNERQLLNVVEEMAVASGTPAPAVFLLHREKGINAFAAGFTPGDAVIGVTDGTVGHLSRDELQGVIAHEFSHILNGDMRLNIRLMAVLHGILVIALTGYALIRALRYSGSDSRGKGGAIMLAIMLLGVALLVIGYIGVFFGRLIKSAVSRQREYLADASAVQFTRNPAGLAGALKKIGGLAAGSRLENPKAEEASHLFFGNGLRKGLMGFLATHPPLVERVRRIDPSFDGVFPRVTARAAPEPALAAELPVAATASQLHAVTSPISAREPAITVDPDVVSVQVGTLDQQHLDYARSLISGLPDELMERVREPMAARAVVYALLLDSDPQIRNVQLRALEEQADPRVYRETTNILRSVDRCAPETHLPLVDLALPALRQLTAEQYRTFYRNVRALAHADQKVSLFEYTLYGLLRRHLAPHFHKTQPPGVQYNSLRKLRPQCSTLLSAVAHFGHADLGEASQAFARGAAELEQAGVKPELLPHTDCDLRAVDHALEQLRLTSPGLKRWIIRAATACVRYDGRVTVQEAEFLRAIADYLDCPMPPFLIGSVTKDPHTATQRVERGCPSCGGLILSTTSVCKHCGSFVKPTE
ncbi:MAG: M48 family metallopeptidase [Gemmatimonadota bacterium]|nr:MAG: M48 family metallopeptidase [Gemmatimonadota bacterium]